MRFPVIWVAAVACILLSGGCGGGSGSQTPSQDELGDYLADNPDVASEAAPPIEDE